MASQDVCEFPGCDNDEDLHDFGFSVDGLIEREWTLCPGHEPPSSCIDPEGIDG